ncbi:MAG: hemoglobin/transferrin/lactoferrin receptor protein [Flavobacterium sp.]|jgi:hemoglobin/transferrin/lactoferrin receptor protein
MHSKLASLLLLSLLPLLSISQSKDSLISNYNLKEVEIASTYFTDKKTNYSQEISILHFPNFGSKPFQTTADYIEKSGKLFIQKSQQGGGSPIIRGFEASRILLKLDGVRLNNLIYRSGHLQNIISVDASLLEQISIFNGASSTYFGSDALGGAIVMQTIRPKLKNDSITSISGKFTSRYASVNQEKAISFALNYASKNWASLTLFSSNSFSDLKMGRRKNNNNPIFGLRENYIETIDGVDQMVPNSNPFLQIQSGYDQFSILQKFVLVQRNKLTHNFNFQYSNSSNIPRYDRLTDTNSNGALRNAEWYYGPQKRVFASYNLDRENLFKNTNFNSQITFQNTEESRHNRRFGNYNLQNRIEKVNALNLTLDLRTTFKNFLLFYGAESNYDNLKSTAFSNNINTNEIKPIDTRYPNGKNYTTKNEMYVSATNRFPAKFNWNLGSRFGFSTLKSTISDDSFFPLPFDIIEQKNTTYSFSGGFIYKTSSQFALVGNISSGFRVPNVDDLSKIFESRNGTIVVPNIDLKPEKTITTDFGIRTSFKNLQIEQTYFYTRLYDAIVTDFFTYNSQPNLIYDGVISNVVANQNKGKAFITGISTKLNYKIDSHWEFDGTFTYTKGQRNENDRRKPLDHIAPFYGRIGIQYKNTFITSSAYLLFNGKKDLKEYSDSGEDNLQYAPKNGTPSWTTYNLTNTLFITKKNALDFGIENILDINYRTFASGINAPGRNFYTALHFQF